MSSKPSVFPGVKAPTITEPITSPEKEPELYPNKICPQQKREFASPDVSP